MATRSTITIWHQTRPGISATPLAHLYRHHDGGLWGNGPDLARAMRVIDDRAYSTPKDKANAFFMYLTGFVDRGFNGSLSARYECTDHADNHADTEYHYDVFVDADLDFLVSVRYRRPGDDWEWVGRASGTVADFRNGVAQELRDIRQREASYEW